MKILFDDQIFSLQKYGGISRYFCELMTRFSENPALDFSVALRVSRNEHLIGLPRLNNRWSRRIRWIPDTFIHAAGKTADRYQRLGYLFTNTLLSINRRESERLLKKQEFDLLHPTYYDPYFLKFLGKKPYIITVHDMIHEIFPNNFPAGDPVRSWKKQVLENADGIIAISQRTKSDMLRFFEIDPDKIRVIYHGNPFEEIPEGTLTGSCHGRFFSEKPFLLFVGNRSGYKNFEFFITAVSETLHKDRELQVVCAGGGTGTAAEMSLLVRLQIQDRVHFVHPDDHGMKNLYLDARVFIFPSLYEGFGLPILEAFACGCPIMACNSSSLPEIGGDAAEYFNPSDVDSFTSTLERILSDETLRARLAGRGYERLKQFSWKKTAESTRQVYEDLVSG